MGTLKVFTGIATIGTAVLLTAKGIIDIRDGVEDIRENGVNLPDLERVNALVENFKEGLGALELAEGVE